MKRQENKGAAMISVLIATVFIAVLATTLLYMAYLNYLTKAIRNSSNDNFYTCEFALDDLSTSLQQIAIESTGDWKSDLRNVCVGSPGTGNGVYDNAKVADLITLAGQFADISVSSDAVGDNFIVSANSVTLKNLIITSTSTKDNDPYVSNIKTDIILSLGMAIPTGGLEPNDFSVITDDVINWVGGGVCTMTGNIFIRSTDWIDAHVTYSGDTGTLDTTYQDLTNEYSTDPQNSAIACGSTDPANSTNGDILSITGDRGIVVGNIFVGYGGVLTISGDVKVIGNIYVCGNGILMCTDKLKCSGKVYQHDDGVIKGVSNPSVTLRDSSINPSYLIDKDKAGTGITSNLFSDFYLVVPTKADGQRDFILCPFTAALHEEWKNTKNGGNSRFGYDTNSSVGYFMETLGQQGPDNSRLKVDNGSVQFMFSTESPLNALSEPTLLFNIWGSSKEFVVEQSLDDTTILSIAQVKNKGSYQNGYRVSHMSDADYEAAKSMLFGYSKYQSDYFRSLLNVEYLTGTNKGHVITSTEMSTLNVNGFSGFAGSSGGDTVTGTNVKYMADMMAIVDDWNKGDKGAPGHPADAVYNHDGSDGVYVYKYTAGSYHQEDRYAVCKDGYTYIPVEYLVRPDAGEFITGIFDSLNNSSDKPVTVATYANWEKF